jgi:hypothetical protein
MEDTALLIEILEFCKRVEEKYRSFGDEVELRIASNILVDVKNKICSPPDANSPCYKVVRAGVSEGGAKIWCRFGWCRRKN